MLIVVLTIGTSDVMFAFDSIPAIFGLMPFLGVRAPQEVDYCVIASPSGPYFPGGVKPVSIWVEDKWFRTGPGGTGFAKCGGNYSPARR